MKHIIKTLYWTIDLEVLKNRFGIDLTEMTDEEAKEIIDKWFEVYEEVMVEAQE